MKWERASVLSRSETRLVWLELSAQGKSCWTQGWRGRRGLCKDSGPHHLAGGWKSTRGSPWRATPWCSCPGCSTLTSLEPPVSGRSSLGTGSSDYKLTESPGCCDHHWLFKLNKQVTLIKNPSVQAPEPGGPARQHLPGSHGPGQQHPHCLVL